MRQHMNVYLKKIEVKTKDDINVNTIYKAYDFIHSKRDSEQVGECSIEIFYM